MRPASEVAQEYVGDKPYAINPAVWDERLQALVSTITQARREGAENMQKRAVALFISGSDRTSMSPDTSAKEILALRLPGDE